MRDAFGAMLLFRSLDEHFYGRQWRQAIVEQAAVENPRR